MRRDRRFGFGHPSATGFETLIVPGTHAVGFQALPPPASASHAIIHVTGAAVRWRADDAPTATTGIRLNAGSYWDMMEYDLDWSSFYQQVMFISLGPESTLEAQFFD